MVTQSVETDRTHLHDLVDALSDEDVAAAQRYLGFLLSGESDLFAWVLNNAPIDDEPSTEEEDAAAAEAREQIHRGEGISGEELKRTLLR